VFAGARGAIVEIDPPIHRLVFGLKMERAAESLHGLLRKETRQELGNELFDACRSDVPVQGPRRGPAIGRNCILGIPTVDSHLDRETSNPPRYPAVVRAGEGPCLRLGVGRSKDLKCPLQVGVVLGGQISGIFRGRVEGAAADAFSGCDDSGHPLENLAGVAGEASGVPLGAVWHRPLPAGLGGG
jgi:hypothetical protein